MRLFLYLSIFFFFSTGYYAAARIHPADNAVLNYRQVLFEYNEVSGADYYLIAIDIPGQKTITVKNYSLAFVREDIFSFGKKYNWFYTAYKNKKAIYKSPIYRFEIKEAIQTSENWLQGKIDVSSEKKYNPGLIFLDYAGLAINRKGEPIWYMPLGKENPDNLKIRNIKMTAAGTITFLDNTDCFEKDIDGYTLWQAPNDGQVSGDGQEYYHHEFFKMKDGTYITAGYKFAEEPNIYDTNVVCKVRYNTIIQYNKDGNATWWWDESKHIDKKKIYGDSGPATTEVAGTHLNGIAYYQPDDAFVVSFRNNSSILKISRKTGEVLYNLGDSLLRYYPGEIPFTGQHGPSLLKDGSIVVYNNNIGGSDKTTGPSYPNVKIFSQPAAHKQSKKLWDYECYSTKHPDGIFGKEGYATQLPYNKNLLVCMGGANYVFEVTPDRKVVWQCTLQHFDENSKEWMALNNYRCSYASSLYPVYFTLQHFKQTTGVAAPTIIFRLNNEGSDDNLFTVELNDKIFLAALNIPAGKYEDIVIKNFNAPRKENSGGRITVYPVGNRTLQREIFFND